MFCYTRVVRCVWFYVLLVLCNVIVCLWCYVFGSMCVFDDVWFHVFGSMGVVRCVWFYIRGSMLVGSMCVFACRIGYICWFDVFGYVLLVICSCGSMRLVICVWRYAFG